MSYFFTYQNQEYYATVRFSAEISLQFMNGNAPYITAKSIGSGDCDELFSKFGVTYQEASLSGGYKNIVDDVYISKDEFLKMKIDPYTSETIEQYLKKSDSINKVTAINKFMKENEATCVVYRDGTDELAAINSAGDLVVEERFLSAIIENKLETSMSGEAHLPPDILV